MRLLAIGDVAWSAGYVLRRGDIARVLAEANAPGSRVAGCLGRRQPLSCPDSAAVDGLLFLPALPPGVAIVLVQQHLLQPLSQVPQLLVEGFDVLSDVLQRLPASDVHDESAITADDVLEPIADFAQLAEHLAAEGRPLADLWLARIAGFDQSHRSSGIRYEERRPAGSVRSGHRP